MTTPIDDSTATASVINVKCLGIVMIYASNTERSARFYKDVLGFAEAADQNLSPGVTLEVPGFQIYIADGREEVAREPMRYPAIGVSLIVAGVKEAFEKAMDARVIILSEYEAASEYFASFIMADPDGNEIEIWGKA